jgi:NADPH2:quinone reductase
MRDRTMLAIRVHAYGSPDVLRIETVPEPTPGPGELRVRVEASGVNFMDVYQRTGLYPVPLPFTPGSEAAGTVDAVGPGVTGFAVGDRVASAMAPGAYATAQIVPAAAALHLPAQVSTHLAAAVLLQGMTAHYLATSTFPLASGQTALIHAAAGGTGLLLTQIAKRRGARVIGTVSSAAKADLARAAGADEVIRYDQRPFDVEAKRLTGGAGVDVVYDSVGATTLEASLRSLRRRGTLVIFGASSGPVPPIDVQILNRSGSLFLTRPTLKDYIADRTELAGRAHDLFTWIADGTLAVRVGHEYPLRDAADAHRALEGRATTGKVLLIP